MKDVLKKITGSVLLINVSDNLKNNLNNKKITESFFIDKLNKKKYSYCKEESKIKKISFNKLSKIFKKKSLNYTIVNYDNLEISIHELVKQTIKITNNQIIIYGKLEKYKIDRIIKIYKRYTKDIIYENNYITINIKQKKYRNIFNFVYFIIDIIYDFFDILGDGLMS